MFINQINKENYKKKLRCLKDTISQNNYNFRFNFISNSDLILLNDSIDPVLYES